MTLAELPVGIIWSHVEHSTRYIKVSNTHPFDPSRIASKLVSGENEILFNTDPLDNVYIHSTKTLAKYFE